MSTLKKIGITMILTLLIIFGGIYGLGCLFFQNHFLPGTSIGGFNCSYKTVTEVNELMDKKVKTYALAIDTRNGGREKLTAEDIQMKYAPNGKTSEILHDQSYLLWFLSQESEHELESTFIVDQTAFEKAVENLDCMNNMEAPTDARIAENEKGFYVIPETYGTKLDKQRAISLIETAVRSGQLEVDLNDCYENPQVTTEDKSLEKKCEKLNKIMDIIITYDFEDRTETVNFDLIRTWLTDYQIDPQKVKTYIEYLSNKYDTYGKKRIFKTYDERSKEIDGGDYGWEIDQEKETVGLIKSIESGETQVRQPVYFHEALSRSENDIGYTYLEYDLEYNKFILYVDGVPAVQATCQAGTQIASGCYTLKTPEERNGSFYYWLPFGDSAFYAEETLPQTDAENMFSDIVNENLSVIPVGCLLIPYETAEQAYPLVSEGLPVIVYD